MMLSNFSMCLLVKGSAVTNYKKNLGFEVMVELKEDFHLSLYKSMVSETVKHYLLLGKPDL